MSSFAPNNRAAKKSACRTCITGALWLACAGVAPMAWGDSPAGTEVAGGQDSAATSSTTVQSVPSSDQQAPAFKKMSMEELMNVEVATVTTASKAPEKTTDAPATVLVVTANDIKLRGYSNLKDVLRDLPGMETTENYFSEVGTNVPVRGIVGNNLIVVLVNGMRVNPPGGEYFPFRSDFNVRDAEQVEVIYGPGSTLYGQDAISAVINVKTKKPVEGQLGEIGADGGLYNEREGWLSLGKTFGNVSLTGYFQYHDSDLSPLDSEYAGWWAPAQKLSNTLTPRGLENSPHREDFGLNGFVRLEAEGWSLQYWHRQSERNSAEGFRPSALGYLDQARWGDKSDVVEARNTLHVSDAVTLDTSVTYNRYEIDPSTRYVFPAGNGSWFLNDFKYGRGTGINGEETLRWQVTPKISLLAGVYAGDFDIIPKSTVPGGADPNSDFAASAGNFNYIDPATGAVISVPRVVEVHYQTYAGYIEGAWQVTDHLKLIGGTRITSDTRLHETPVTPRASVVYGLTNNVTAKYIYTEAFVAPAPYFGFATFDNGSQLATSNPNLQAEKARSHEVNLNYAKENLNLGISGYYGEQSNLILVADRGAAANVIGNQQVTEVDANGNVIGQRTLVHSANGGNSRNFGVDLYGRATFGPFSPWASYSYVDFQQTVDGVTTGVAGTSRHNGRLGVTWAATNKLFITPSMVIRSTPENVIPDGLHLGSLPFELNLHMLYNITDHWHAFVDIRNLTNHKYALGGFAGNTQGVFATPQEGIHGVVGLELTY